MKTMKPSRKIRQTSLSLLQPLRCSISLNGISQNRRNTWLGLLRIIPNHLIKTSLVRDIMNLWKAVADFNLFIKLAKTLPTERYFPLILDRGFNKEFYCDQAYSSLNGFIKMYENWYNELATNNRAFAPLNTDTSDLTQFVKCMSLDARDDSYYLLQMIKDSKDDKKDNHSNKFRYFLDFAYSAIDHYTSKILK